MPSKESESEITGPPRKEMRTHCIFVTFSFTFFEFPFIILYCLCGFSAKDNFLFNF